MILQAEDLDAAVAQGVLTEAQATGLRDFAVQREKARIAALGHEERFRFMRGFNDFFFAVGVILLAGGMTFFAGSTTIGHLIAAAIIWALAELLVGRLRLVLPGILLAALFVAFVYAALSFALWTPPFHANALTALGFGPYGVSSPMAKEARNLIAILAAVMFYARFRLPFALLLIAGGFVFAVMTAVVPDAPPWMVSALLLVCGLGVFLAAMSFDFSDPERMTRRADCAFWLHLLAAPLIVHSLVSLVAPTANAYAMTGKLSVLIVALMVLLLAIVAVLIDRRALFVSALGYLGAVIAYTIHNTGLGLTDNASDNGAYVFSATLLILGALVLVLGVGWLSLRRPLMSLVPAGLARRLPPVLA